MYKTLSKISCNKLQYSKAEVNIIHFDTQFKQDFNINGIIAAFIILMIFDKCLKFIYLTLVVSVVV